VYKLKTLAGNLFVVSDPAGVKRVLVDVKRVLVNNVGNYPKSPLEFQTLWRDPDCFDPGRFSTEHSAERDRFAYLPFGGGPRICIGAALAMTEAP
jgi:cytochrome P450